MTIERLQAYIDFFEGLQPASLDRLDHHFSERVHFVDPFNDVHGLAGVRAVLEHMFTTCRQPQFTVEEHACNGPVAYLRWRFAFGAAASRHTIEGVSRVAFDDEGRVVEHVDYWDPATQLYEAIPVLGRLFLALRRRLRARPAPATTTRPAPGAVTER